MSDDEVRVAAVLSDIARFARTADRVRARGRVTFFDPENDDQRRIARSLVIDLATAADRLPAGFRDAHPGIDWTGIHATRNFIAPDYDGTDDEILWQAIVRDVPRIVAALGLE